MSSTSDMSAAHRIHHVLSEQEEALLAHKHRIYSSEDTLRRALMRLDVAVPLMVHDASTDDPSDPATIRE